MNRRSMTLALLTVWTGLFAQEITGIGKCRKNDKGEFVKQNTCSMFETLKFSEALKPGFYSLTCELADNFPTTVWAVGTGGAAGGYVQYGKAQTPRLIRYYFKVTDFAKMKFRMHACTPKGNKTPVNFAVRDFRLTALNGIPGNMFPDFNTALKQTPDGEDFIYCFNAQFYKTISITRTTADGIPALQVEGIAKKTWGAVAESIAFPVAKKGTLTVKFTAKSVVGSKKMFVLVRDNFWKKGGDRKYFTLTNDWAEYSFEIDCAKKFKDGIVLAVADCRFCQGVYLFKDFSVTYEK